MKCKKCGAYETEVRVAPIVGDPLCQDCWDDVQADMRRRGAKSPRDYAEYVRNLYPLFLRGYNAG